MALPKNLDVPAGSVFTSKNVQIQLAQKAWDEISGLFPQFD
jgi:hypothetical protein